MSCHTDHNYFNANKGANLRQGIGLARSQTTNTDFSPSSPYGICISCHSTALSKNVTGQASSTNSTTADPSASSVEVSGTAYDTSAHNYSVQTLLSSTSSPFNANC